MDPFERKFVALLRHKEGSLLHRLSINCPVQAKRVRMDEYDFHCIALFSFQNLRILDDDLDSVEIDTTRPDQNVQK